jgi:hypothetical protein
LARAHSPCGERTFKVTRRLAVEQGLERRPFHPI